MSLTTSWAYTSTRGVTWEEFQELKLVLADALEILSDERVPLEVRAKAIAVLQRIGTKP